MSNSGQKQSAKSQDWLPSGWVMEIKERPGGILKDKYYIEPVNGYKFRSKKEVFRFLETGESGRRKERIPKPSDKVGDVAKGGTIEGNKTQDTPVERNTGGSNLGWQVKFVERENGVTEKYFIEPVNGYKFYSEKEIVHYLQTMEAPIPKKIEESVVAMEVATPKKVATPKISDKSNVVRASQDRSLGRPLDWLPPGWKVEFCERKNGTVPDKYYIDPVSGYKFRSRKDVSRYLENGVFPPRAGKKRKVNDAELSGQGVLSLSSVDKRQKLACRSTTKGLFPGENDLQNSAVTPNSAVREEEKPSEGRASHQCMEGLECRDKSDESKSRENYMVDEVTHALPLSVFSPQQHAMGKRGKGKPKPKPERKKSERKNDPANRKLRPAPIKSRNRKESTLPCRTSRRLAEIKPKEVDNDVPKVRAEVDTVGLEGEVNEVGKTPVGENDSMIEENIQRFESNDTESVIAMLFGESSSSMDPCLEFAYRTLAGIIPDGESPC